MVLVVAGALDLDTAPRLWMALDHLLIGGSASFELDLSRVTTVTAVGLAVIVGIQQRARQHGGQAVLTRTSVFVDRVVRQAGLTQLLAPPAATGRAALAD
jgi:anti-anti-sigma factor